MKIERKWVLLLGVEVMLVALNLRMLFPSLSVLLPEIRSSVGLSSATAGYLTTLPVLCLGAFAPFAPGIARRFGIERTLFFVLLFLAAGTAVRGWSGAFGLFLGSALGGASIAVGNVLLPALVKRDFAAHAALMTALYTVALNGGSALAAALTLPLALAVGDSWRVGLVVWAVPPVIAAAVWFSQVRRKAGAGQQQKVGHVHGLWRSTLAWQVTIFMGLQSTLAYCVSGWLAPILRDRGMDGTVAGFVTSVCIFTNIAGSLVLPPLIARFRDQRWINVVLSVMAGVPLLGILFAPLGTAWLWAVAQGLGQGGMFAMALTLIILRSPNPTLAAHLSSMAQTGGYLVACMGPLLIGLLAEWTGGFAASGWLFAAVTAGAVVSGFGAGRALYVQGR